MSRPLLDPRNDYVFKRLFVNSPALLADLINAVRRDEAPIEVVEILNPRIEPEDLAGKFIVLDVLARDKLGHLFNIEMQIRQRDPWSARSIYYLARALANQIKPGENYAALKPAIGIHLLDFQLFPDPQQALWCFELRDRVQPHVMLGPELQLNIIELSKADRLANFSGALSAWIAYFKHGREENCMNQIAYPPVQQAVEQLKALSADDEARYLAYTRERALLDEASELAFAKNAGREEGREEGMLLGQAAVLQRLLTRRFGTLDDSVRVKLSTATHDQLDAWTDRVLEAKSINEVFDTH